jgi:hypothetical protein
MKRQRSPPARYPRGRGLRVAYGDPAGGGESRTRHQRARASPIAQPLCRMSGYRQRAQERLTRPRGALMRRDALGLSRLWAAFILVRFAGVLTDLAARMVPGCLSR